MIDILSVACKLSFNHNQLIIFLTSFKLEKSKISEWYEIYHKNKPMGNGTINHIFSLF